MKCPICELEVSKHRSHVVRHIRNVHKDTSAHILSSVPLEQCDVCGRGVTNIHAHRQTKRCVATKEKNKKKVKENRDADGGNETNVAVGDTQDNRPGKRKKSAPVQEVDKELADHCPKPGSSGMSTREEWWFQRDVDLDDAYEKYKKRRNKGYRLWDEKITKLTDEVRRLKEENKNLREANLRLEKSPGELQKEPTEADDENEGETVTGEKEAGPETFTQTLQDTEGLAEKETLATLIQSLTTLRRVSLITEGNWFWKGNVLSTNTKGLNAQETTIVTKINKKLS